MLMDSDYVAEPMIRGETIQRYYMRWYPKLREQTRQHPVNFAAVPALQMLLRGIPDGPTCPEARPNESPMTGVIAQARRHLFDATNEELPEEVRIQHLDIAGSKVYRAKTIMLFDVPNWETWLQRYVEAGGA